MNYKTIDSEAKVTEIVKKSRFIGYTKPVKTVEEANEFIEKIKKMNWDASHNVPVYILGDKQEIQKFSDDGEPSGTAGVPILDMFKKEGITNIAIVVTRYFGGTKLGTGGLVRAYSKTAKEALLESNIIEMVEYRKISIKLDYTLHGKFQNFISLNTEYLLIDTVYTSDVEILMYIKTPDIENFVSRVIDLTSDKCIIELSDFDKLKISNDKWMR